MWVLIANLILASIASLILLVAMLGGRWAGTPQWIDHSLDAWGFLILVIALCWFAGAVGLFFRKPLAWVGSLIGVGLSVCLFAASLVTIIGIYLIPDAEMDHLRHFGWGGYLFATVFGIGQFSLLLAISIWVFIGLLRKRKKLLDYTP
jgi:hypothetical protein